MNRKELVNLIKTSFRDWREDNAVLRAGALTFFIILPLPSLLLILIGFFGVFYGQTQATHIVAQQITAIAGPAVAELFRQLLQGAASPFAADWASVGLVIFSVIGGIGAFAVLRDTMDVIWEVKLPSRKKLKERIKQAIGPFILVSLLGLIVIFWTGVATSLFSAIRLLSINATLTLVSITVVQVSLSFGLSTLLFALIYKEIPLIKIHWADVNIASIITGIAFTVTNYVFGIYIQTFTVTTIIGAAGALLIILLWIFILNQIVLFGAEVSKVYATTIGPHPLEHLPGIAQRIVEPIEKAAEKIEEATKGNYPQHTIFTVNKESTATENSLEKQEASPQTLPPPKITVQVEEEAKPEPKTEGSVEVDIKIKSPKKPRKKQD
jgi:membrane protein